MKLKVTSTAFADGAAIPVDYTADGRDFSPQLAWSEPPAGTASLVVLCEDPDAPCGIFTHWVLFNLPGNTRELTQDQSRAAAWPSGAGQGTNDFGAIGFNEPSPPPGKPHRYFFKVYALDTQLTLQSDATRLQLLSAMSGHVIAEGELMGIYGRKN